MDNRVRIHISAGALIFLAALLLLLPLQWIGAALIAAIVHELCHAVVICAFGGRIAQIRIGSRGVVMETAPLSAIREAICAFAGPLGSFSLILLARWMPRTAICGFVHGLYNLIPLFPMDGGRVLRSLMFCIFSPPVARRVFYWTQKFVLALLVVGCLLVIRRVGIFVILFGMLLLFRCKGENTLAKKPFWRYNRSIIDKGVRL